MPIKPIILQRRLAEVGRIRIGEVVSTKSGKTRPSKLDRLRFTSPSRPLIERVAAAYGGEVREWTPANGGAAQWEVITDTARVPVIIPPGSITQYMEAWSGGGCVRRCDGETELLTNEACICRASEDMQCRPTTRLSVMLRDIEGLGVWRLESKGWNAAAELPGMADFLERAGGYVSAWLYLKPVRQVTNGQTRDFMVPALDGEGVTPGQLAAGTAPAAIGNGGQPAELEAGRPDYVAQAEAATTLAEWRVVWAAARDAGHLTQSLKDTLTPIGQALRPPPAEPAAEPAGDVDELWNQVVAAWPGDSLADIEQAFAARFEGIAPESATAEQLAEFLAAIKAGQVTA